MRLAREWAVRHSRGLEWLYQIFEATLLRLHPLLNVIGYDRLERPIAAIERALKGLMFDCRMCGQCVLSSTGMSCPMICPKELRNGPCGGVRSNGHCEVDPQMRCVWVAAVEGARQMRSGMSIQLVQFPVDRRLAGKSSWLRAVRLKAEHLRGEKINSNELDTI